MPQKILRITAVLILVTGIFLGFMQKNAEALGGAGTQADPWLITTCSELKNIDSNASLASDYFKLVNDVDCTGSSFGQITFNGNGFSGHFDGNGKTVSNLTQNVYFKAGMFSYVHDAVIHDLTLTGASVDSQQGGVLVGGIENSTLSNISVSGTAMFRGNYGNGGGLAGSIRNVTINDAVTNVAVTSTANGASYFGGLVGELNGTTSSLTRCAALGDISITGNNVDAVGGLVGIFSSGSIAQSFASGNITVSSAGTKSSTAFGGLVGDVYAELTVSDSYATGNVTAGTSGSSNRGTGGLVGMVSSSSKLTATHVYSTGQVSGYKSGGLIGIGSNSTTTHTTGSFWDTETSGMPTSPYEEIGKTTAAMKTASTFTDASWDMAVWGIHSTINGGYPGLQWYYDFPVVPPPTTNTSFSNAGTSTPIDLTTPSGTDITSHSVELEDSSHADGSYTYPLGFVTFTYDTTNANDEITLVFVTDLLPSQVVARKYEATSHTYANVPGAAITEITYGGQHALQLVYTVADNGPLDLDPTIGKVDDPVGLGVVVPPPSGSAGGSAGTTGSGATNTQGGAVQAPNTGLKVASLPFPAITLGAGVVVIIVVIALFIHEQRKR